jgi:hypothetical protein
LPFLFFRPNRRGSVCISVRVCINPLFRHGRCFSLGWWKSRCGCGWNYIWNKINWRIFRCQRDGFFTSWTWHDLPRAFRRVFDGLPAVRTRAFEIVVHSIYLVFKRPLPRSSTPNCHWPARLGLGWGARPSRWPFPASRQNRFPNYPQRRQARHICRTPSQNNFQPRRGGIICHTPDDVAPDGA